MAGENNQPDFGLVVEADKPKLEEPSLYRVMLLNDDYTPMEFVVDVLQKIFLPDEARRQSRRIANTNDALRTHGLGTVRAAVARLERELRG